MSGIGDTPNVFSARTVDVSVVVVIFKDYIQPLEMITSLELFTSKELSKEIFAIDNSQPENDRILINQRDMFLRALLKYDDFQYIDASANLGFGRANNVGLALAHSRYHAVVNPDILFVDDALSALCSFLDRNESIGMAVPKMVDQEGCMQSAYRNYPTVLDALNRTLLGSRFRRREHNHTLQDRDYTKPFAVPFGQGSFLFGRTSLLKSVGGFDERYFMYLEDADLCRRVNQCSSLIYCPEATVVHIWNRKSHKDPALFIRHLKSYCSYFRKWGLSLA